MKKQIFKFTNHIVTYLGGGKYKLDADAGYVLKSKNGQKVRSVETRDYTEWSAVEESAEEARKTKNKQ